MFFSRNAGTATIAPIAVVNRRPREQRQQIRQARLFGQQSRGISADTEEGGMAQADLSGIAGQEIEAERDQREDFGQRQQIKAVAVEAERRSAGQQQAQARAAHRSSPRAARPRGRGGYRPRRSRFAHPDPAEMPSGRIVSTAMMTMKVVASAKDGET